LSASLSSVSRPIAWKKTGSSLQAEDLEAKTILTYDILANMLSSHYLVRGIAREFSVLLLEAKT
jgi:hypothetical protein